MGAIPKKTVDYFPHFTRIGVTRRVLEAKYGNDGYAFWYKLLETLCNSDQHFFDFTHNLSRVDFLTFVRMDEGKAVEILDLLAELEVIDPQLWKTKRVIWSQRLVDYLAPLYKKRIIKEKPARPHSGAGMSEVDTKSIHSGTGMTADKPIPAPDIAFPTPDIHRVEESRVEESREGETRTRTGGPALQEIAAYAAARKSPVDPQRFWAYHQARGWLDKQDRPLTNWQAQFLYWETLEKTKVPVAQATVAPVDVLQAAHDKGAALAEGFHLQALAGGICRYCGRVPEFYARPDGSPSTIQQPCNCAEYQAEFEKAVKPALAAATK